MNFVIANAFAALDQVARGPQSCARGRYCKLKMRGMLRSRNFAALRAALNQPRIEEPSRNARSTGCAPLTSVPTIGRTYPRHWGLLA